MGIDKIARLMERLECVKLNRSMEPVPDGLSLSLLEMGAELSALDAAGVDALADALDITPDDVREMALHYSR